MNAMIVPWRDGSRVWRKTLECRDSIEHQIAWQPKMGSSLFLFENWTGLGALYFVTPPDFFCDQSIQNMYEVMQGNRWNTASLYQLLPEDLAGYILNNVKPPMQDGILDKPIWMLDPRGEFSVRRLGYLMASKCWCCVLAQEETMSHLFFTSYAARKVWKYFLSAAGINVERLTFHQAIVKCWTMKVVPRLQPILQALHSIIIWELWKRRNGYKYGESVSVNRVMYKISTMLQYRVKFRKPSLQHVPHKWPDLVIMMEQYTPKLKYTKVLRELPEQGWIILITDGASRGNPGRNSFGYVLRNEEGDIIYACGKEIQEGTNIKAEVRAILEAMKYCVDNDYILIDLHTDSMMIKKMIQGEWSVPWTIAAEVEEIKELMERCNLKLSHTLREGN
ncbi:PREDICTED: uncharacterized protein LOC109212407 [Nicotiana attenuata]|uniref:uncharacterized protein LOC109212407 n=1 Tax=Nicotiana attenuata TaxID=49451 RepID=UPI000905BB8F|nr:PREDICTED: uncharacterized protein LOC109212407 [Nicotiana attenuata]